MSYLEPKIRYMNSVSGSSAGNLPDAEEAYWTTLETSGPPAGDVTSANITDATATGIAVLTATSATTARTALGAGTSSLAVATTAPAALAATAAVGTGTTAARADHVHAIPGASNGTLRGTVLRAAAQADSTATDVAGLVADFNAILAKLRTAGVIA